jgi:hypothetical protein
MPEEVQPEQFHLNIKKVRLTAFKINEEVDAPTSQLQKINMQQMIQYSLTDLTITLDLTISFSTPEDLLFMEGTSQNVFTIQELAKMVVSENQDLINIPDNILTMLLSISISHTRALMSQSALGSKFQDIIIPIVNPGDLVSKINPSIISK